MTTFSEQLDALAKIQKLDLRIRDLKTALAAVPGRCEQLSRRMNDQIAELDSRKAEREALQTAYRERDREVKDLTALIQRSNTRLQEVKTNKEYESVLKEIDDVKRHISEIEDAMIADLDAIDLAETAVAAAEAALAEAKDTIAVEIEEVTRRGEADEALLAELETEAARLAGDVSEGLLNRYRYIQQRKPDAVAACEVIDAVCQGCKLSIPQQLYNNLQRRDTLMQCPKCERIIYWLKRIQ